MKRSVAALVSFVRLSRKCLGGCPDPHHGDGVRPQGPESGKINTLIIVCETLVRYDEEPLTHLPKGVIAFPGSSITENTLSGRSPAQASSLPSGRGPESWPFMSSSRSVSSTTAMGALSP